jgi:predicted aspartyl protease
MSTSWIPAVVDSGADLTIFHSGYATMLGIDRTGCTRHRCAGFDSSTQQGTIHKVEIELSGYRYDTEVFFVDNLQVPGLLGLHGFLDRFECRLDLSKGSLELHFIHDKGRVILPV